MPINLNKSLGISILLLLILISWYVGGIWYSDMYGIPSLLLTIFFITSSNDELKNYLMMFSKYIFYYRKNILIFIAFNLLVHLTTGILRYISFDYATWDVGVFSNILFNFSNNEFFSSFLSSHFNFNVNGLADHFAISMYPLGWLYAIYPSTLWLIVAKSISFLICPLLFYKISRTIGLTEKISTTITLVLSLFWILIYKPPLNGLHFEFQPSSLALPFVFISFYFLSSKKWIPFWLTMLFLLGFKEHLGLVWIGFGLYLYFNGEKKYGLLLCFIGLLSLYTIMFQLMPYLRDYRQNWSLFIGPFDDIQKKLLYIFRIFAPFGFLHFIRWKYGIMTFPLIGANLLIGTTKSSVYSMTTHYDDILSCMLFISMILIIKEMHDKKYFIKYFSKWFFLVWFIIVLGDTHRSPLRFMSLHLPTKSHFILANEIRDFDHKNREKRYAVQGHLGPHFHRRGIEEFRQYKYCGKQPDGKNLLEVDYIALSNLAGHAWTINDMELCIIELNKLDDYERVTKYNQLIVFKKIQ